MVCHCFYCAKISILRNINKFFPHKKQSEIIFFVNKSIPEWSRIISFANKSIRERSEIVFFVNASIREGSGIVSFVNKSIREGSGIISFVNKTIREGSRIDSFVNKIIFEGSGTIYYAIAHPDHTLCGIYTAFTSYFSISIMERIHTTSS